jgi:hypothetical protein
MYILSILAALILVFKNGVKNIQASAYNGARTVAERREFQLICLITIAMHCCVQ